MTRSAGGFRCAGGEYPCGMSACEQHGDDPATGRDYVDELLDFLDSDPVQALIAGRVDHIQLTGAKSYAGQASLRNGLRLMRLSVYHQLDLDEMAFVICHELAHHEVGVEDAHSDDWREMCAELAREAGRLNLLPPKRVEQAVHLALEGAATRFRGWPEQARKVLEKREDVRAQNREKLIESGLRVGGEIGFEYRGRKVRGEVIRINRTTVSVGEPGGDRTLVRVPFDRVRVIYVD